jgi:hypothetical protein
MFMKVVWGFEPRSQNHAAIKWMNRLLGQFVTENRDLNDLPVILAKENKRC